MKVEGFGEVEFVVELREGLEGGGGVHELDGDGGGRGKGGEEDGAEGPVAEAARGGEGGGGAAEIGERVAPERGLLRCRGWGGAGAPKAEVAAEEEKKDDECCDGGGDDGNGDGCDVVVVVVEEW